MNDNPWVDVRVRLPPEKQMVMTKISDRDGDRNEQPLQRVRQLWHLADMSMYVYYTPTHWRHIA